MHPGSDAALTWYCCHLSSKPSRQSDTSPHMLLMYHRTHQPQPLQGETISHSQHECQGGQHHRQSVGWMVQLQSQQNCFESAYQDYGHWVHQTQDECVVHHAPSRHCRHWPVSAFPEGMAMAWHAEQPGCIVKILLLSTSAECSPPAAVDAALLPKSASHLWTASMVHVTVVLFTECGSREAIYKRASCQATTGNHWWHNNWIKWQVLCLGQAGNTVVTCENVFHGQVRLQSACSSCNQLIKFCISGA